MLIKRLLRHRFGRRSEQLDADQLQFGLEDLELNLGVRRLLEGLSPDQSLQVFAPAGSGRVANIFPVEEERVIG